MPWELVAAGYEATTMHYLGQYCRLILDELDVGLASRVVDVACGPGTVTRMVAGSVASVDAIDFSAPMIELLNRHLEQQKISNVRAVVGDGQQLPYGSDQFDAAFSMFGLMFFPDRIKGFKYRCRVRKP